MKAVAGRFLLEVDYGQGPIRHRGKNLLVMGGRTTMMRRILADTYSPPSHVAFGSGTNTALIGDTALQSEQYAYDIRTNGEVNAHTISVDGMKFGIQISRAAQVTYAGAPFTANEAGIFGRVGGKTAVMYARFLLQKTEFTTGMKFTFGWTFDFEDEG